ncbi:hypothetical protein ACFL5O_04250 [Myxococcota bacterium]
MTRMMGWWWAAVGMLMANPLQAHGAETVYFAHRDAAYLWPGQRRGGLAFVPSTVKPEVPVPLVVFLHGVNARGVVHSWFGGGRWDLRDKLEQIARQTEAQFVVAAPSHTRRASFCGTLWQDFDTQALVEDATQAVAGLATIDLDQIYLVGHSGAGCNPEGGLLGAVAPRSSFHPRGLLAIDTCLDKKVARHLAHRPADTRLWVTWQDASWRRATDEFRAVLESQQPDDAWFRMETVETHSRDPHNAVVLPSIRRMIKEWIAMDPTRGEKGAPESSVEQPISTGISGS